jgi:hypothetical protein
VSILTAVFTVEGHNDPYDILDIQTLYSSVYRQEMVHVPGFDGLFTQTRP